MAIGASLALRSQDPYPLKLDSLHGLRGSCVQNRLVYHAPSSGDSPVRGCRDPHALRCLAPCLSFSPTSLTIPAAFPTASLIYRFGARKHPYFPLLRPGSRQGGQG